MAAAAATDDQKPVLSEASLSASLLGALKQKKNILFSSAPLAQNVMLCYGLSFFPVNGYCVFPVMWVFHFPVMWVYYR